MHSVFGGSDNVSTDVAQSNAVGKPKDSGLGPFFLIYVNNISSTLKDFRIA